MSLLHNSPVLIPAGYGGSFRAFRRMVDACLPFYSNVLTNPRYDLNH